MEKKQKQNITPFIKIAYYTYFGIKIGDQKKSWEPHKICKICIQYLKNWTKICKIISRFEIPMVCHETKNHGDDCYF